MTMLIQENEKKITILSKDGLTRVFSGTEDISDTISHIEIKLECQEVNTAVITFNNVNVEIEVDEDKVEKNWPISNVMSLKDIQAVLNGTEISQELKDRVNSSFIQD